MAEGALDRDRFRGAMVGLAVGDAIGTTVEFKAPGTFERVTEMVGGGPFALPAGAWTDDTSMAMCLAESLVECHGFDPVDQLERYLRWYREGYWSSTGRCFDIGNATRAALERFERERLPFPGDADTAAAGNGPLMKLAPVALAYAAHPAEAVRRAGLSARTTHGAPEAIDACRYLAALLVGAARGAQAHELIDGLPLNLPEGIGDREPLNPKVAAVARGSFRAKEPPAIRGGGYVVDALEAALWALRSTDSFEDGVLAAVNLGDDADTTGAIFGQLAGALYGFDGIPDRWRERVAMAPEIVAMADRLFDLAHSITDQPRRPSTIASEGLGTVLRPDEVPTPDADWNEIAAFASTFHGYHHLGQRRWVCEDIHRRFVETGELPEDVDDLRACLFLAFRADRFTWGDEVAFAPDSEGVIHIGNNPDFDKSPTQRYRRAIISRIRERLDSRA